MPKKERRLLVGEITLTEQQRDRKLVDFLVRNRFALTAARSLSQLIDAGGNIPLGLIEQMAKDIEVESNGKLNQFSGSLCEIWDHTQEFQHHGRVFGDELTGELDSVKGFHIGWTEDGHDWEVVDLDAGRSREYVTEMMTPEQRIAFTARFANRQRGSMYYPGKSLRFPRMLHLITSDDGYPNIEAIVSHHAPPDGVNFNDPNCTSSK